MDGSNIYDVEDKIIQRENGFGYGIILKSQNPFHSNGKGIAFLIGGFGVLGTAAAAYYFKENIRNLGKEFGDAYFSILVRAPFTAGIEAVERLTSYDRRFGF